MGRSAGTLLSSIVDEACVFGTDSRACSGERVAPFSLASYPSGLCHRLGCDPSKLIRRPKQARLVMVAFTSLCEKSARGAQFPQRYRRQPDVGIGHINVGVVLRGESCGLASAELRIPSLKRGAEFVIEDVHADLQ